MADRVPRLQFTEDELSDRDIRKAAKKAKKAADKADKAKGKLPTRRRVRITRTDGVAEATDEGLSGKLRGERQSPKPDPEKAPRRRSRISRKDGISEASEERLSDKLHSDRQATRAVRGKLRLEKEEVTAERPGAAGRAAVNAPAAVISVARNTVRDAVGDSDSDNSGVDAVRGGESALHTAGNTAVNGGYSRKLKQFDKAAKLEGKADKANVDALYQKHVKANPEAASNPISRWQQKRMLKREYIAAKAGKTSQTASGAAKGAQSVAARLKEAVGKAVSLVTKNPQVLLYILGIAAVIIVIVALFSSIGAMFAGGGNMVLGSSYTAEDADIQGADADYSALESALAAQEANIESTYSGYDEYRYNLAEIGHNPYELAAYLTVMYEDYTRAGVQGALQALYAQQYTLTVTGEVEVRTRIETRTGTITCTDPETGESYDVDYEYEVEVEYNYYILNVSLTNTGLDAVIRSSGLTSDQLERYDVLMETLGNRPDLFSGVSFAVNTGQYTDYDIPGEALTDTRFRNMITEAEKYLGMAYVWGGSSPSTGFDCSGFVSYVINNCGNGWSVGRLGAKGLRQMCSTIPPSEAKPGDLIFFHHTYDAPDPADATHVGIYVGGGMMIHCGNPISYASIESSYWQQHFLCFGRIPN